MCALSSAGANRGSRHLPRSFALLAIGWALAWPPLAASQWQPIGLSGRQVNRLFAHGGCLYACTSNGLHRISLAVYAIAGHPTDPDVVYLGMEGRVMMSEDGGASRWTMTSPGPSLYTFGMAVRPHLPLKVFAGGASYVPDPRGVVFYQSYDGGLSWRAFSYPAYAGYGVNHILLTTDGSTEILHVATGNGVHRHVQVTVGVPALDPAQEIVLRCRPNPARCVLLYAQGRRPSAIAQGHAPAMTGKSRVAARAAPMGT